MRCFLIAVFLVVTCATGAAADPAEDAISAYRRGDYAVAARLFLHLAEQDHADAQSNLGVMYWAGLGVPLDNQEAVKWFRKAAEQGHPEGQYNLGRMYREGQGIPQDYRQALKWYRLAAEQGHADAQGSLGFMYDSENGVPQDLVRAHMWFTVSAEASGNTVSLMFRDHVASRMTAAQIAKAHEMARRCQETKFKECD
jgi:TPR repeat protein